MSNTSFAAGADALFLEVHPDPAKGVSDTTNMLPLHRLRPLLEQVLDIRAALEAGEDADAADDGEARG